MDFVDVDVRGDVPLFVNPGALRKNKSEWAERCTNLMRDFMEVVLARIRVDDLDGARDLLIYLSEPNETHLGYTRAGSDSQGHAVGEEFAELIIDAIRNSPAGRTGRIVDLEDTVMMIDGIGSDLISDITTNIIRGPLIEYTNDMCETYGVDTSSFRLRQDQTVWDPVEHTWEQPEVALPVANGKPLILVPKWIVRKQVNADRYFRDYLQPFIAQRELENPNSEFVRTLKNKGREPNIKEIQKKFSTKAVAARLLAENEDLYQKYRNAVNQGDPRKLDDATVISTVHSRSPKLDDLLEEVVSIPTGRDHAKAYEKAIDRLFGALFSNELLFPRPQQPQNSGQKVLDILWTNGAQSGFFDWVKMQCNAAYVISEYKNYSEEVSNPEFDQLAMRFGKSKGQLGFLICRKVSNRVAAVKRAREICQQQGFIIVLDDDDLRGLVAAAKAGPKDVFGFLMSHFTRIAQ